MTSSPQAPDSVRSRSAYICVGAVAAGIAAVSYSSFLAGLWTGKGSGLGGGFISQAEMPGQPFAAWYRLSDVAAGVAILALAWFARPVLAGTRYAVAVFMLVAAMGAASVADGASTMGCNPTRNAACAASEHSASGLLDQLAAVHTMTGLTGFAASTVGAVLLGAAIVRRQPRWGCAHIVIGSVIGACGLLDVGLLLSGYDIGLSERVRTVATSVWLLAVGALLLGHKITVVARFVGRPFIHVRIPGSAATSPPLATSKPAAYLAQPFTATGPARLVPTTSGGSSNRATRAYADNVALQADPPTDHTEGQVRHAVRKSPGTGDNPHSP